MGLFWIVDLTENAGEAGAKRQVRSAPGSWGSQCPQLPHPADLSCLHGPARVQAPSTLSASACPIAEKIVKQKRGLHCPPGTESQEALVGEGPCSWCPCPELP